MQKLSGALLALLGLFSLSAQADVNFAQQAANDYGLHAQKLNKNSKLTAEAGRAFYTKKVVVDGKDLSCSACHTDNPGATGKHNETGKPIKPLAPSANPDRFSDRGKAEKNFSKHCRDLYGKDCSPQDKGDFVTYLLTVK
jgi:cytochrome c peroxidase